LARRCGTASIRAASTQIIFESDVSAREIRYGVAVHHRWRVFFILFFFFFFPIIVQHIVIE